MDLYDDLLSPAEASKILKVSKRTVLRWLENGKLPGIRVGDRLIKIPRKLLGTVITEYKVKKNVKQKSKIPDYEGDPFLYVDEWAPDPGENIPEDMAEEHDHYLYGTPGKEERKGQASRPVL